VGGRRRMDPAGGPAEDHPQEDEAGAGEEDQSQGPNALTGEAAAAEESAAQERMLRSPSTPPAGRSVRDRLWKAFEARFPITSVMLYPIPTDVPEGFEQRLAMVHADYPNEECSICLGPLGSCVTTPCGHHFHAACLEHYFNTSRQPGQRPRCPYCRCSVHAPLPIEVRAASGLPIEAVCVPNRGGRCHFDRNYQWLHLGDFNKPRMLYLLTSNEDRKTSSTRMMWVIEASVPCTVHLNYRSQRHVVDGRQESWLAAKGFVLNGDLRSPSSSGYPNGPYSGPTFSKACAPGTIELMGSECWEGTYFVFIECGAGAE